MATSFSRVDGELASKEREVGSTASVAVVGPERIVVANCGDSRAVLSRGDMAVPLSSDHKADRPDERKRVEAAGGVVINWDVYRVSGVLATSRSIGDHYLRPYVISEPEVTVTNRTEEDELLVLASDGLWDVVSNEVVCKVASQCLSGQLVRKVPDGAREHRAKEAAIILAELALSRGSRDNISVVVVEL
ncbi:protein serine/threonine phosphatase [Musa troglodytarum]|nr:protein serine/threonine phosphatase [Musa troglodytarum]